MTSTAVAAEPFPSVVETITADTVQRADGPSFFRLRPPAPIRLLTATWDRSHNPPRATSGHVALEYPVTSGIVVSRNLYAVTDEMRDALMDSDLTGFAFGPLAVTRSHHLVGDGLACTSALHTLVLTGRACRSDIAPWRCDSLALSRRAARFFWKHDPALLAFTTSLDVIS
ncbi:hypothetical protein [Williamsia phyllosphaerae]|uniref:Uncharacterized protein n=1 Tax=Williamsia phyllosphaerae TaxID=885042 RepID=A0ABQ1UHH2_9NOCA|nr:hypothetical protein [Williamsia phyllosphaerae]GGF17607.1 hypothetical protein GCM10007298_12010 [Williamsia phyllosphaerae]